jgi:hypothetical protein
LLSELDIFGWLRFHNSLAGALEPDRHPNAFEIHYMVRGHLHWWVGKETDHHDFNTGNVFVIHPGELHGGEEGSIQPCEHYWLRIRFPDNEPLPSLTAANTKALREAYQQINCRLARSKGISGAPAGRTPQRALRGVVADGALNVARVADHDPS